MFAKFSPDGLKVAYVRENNVYVEDLATHSVRALTSDGSADIINGTSDWVNEEELDIRDAFRWSPDSRSHRILELRSERCAGMDAHRRHLWPGSSDAPLSLSAGRHDQ